MRGPRASTGPGRTAIQALGSTQTYLQRYTLKAALGLSASKDDDGAGGAVMHDEAAEAEWLERISGCGSMDKLQAYWLGVWPDIKATPKPVQGRMIAAKDAAKKRIAGAGQ